MQPGPTSDGRPAHPRGVIFVIASVQFVSQLAFVMVPPLGPDFAPDLRIALSEVGKVAAAYTISAGVISAFASSIVGRFSKNAALPLALAGLGIATLATGFATGRSSLLACRLIAGIFGGPTLALALALITDLVPVSGRGRAFAWLTGAFAGAQALGIPFCLEMARRLGWRGAFITVAVLTLAVAVAAAVLLPRVPPAARATAVVRAPLGWSKPLMSLSMSGALMMQTFLLVPNLAAYLRYNDGVPREQLASVFLIGGAATFVGSKAGHLVDRFGGPPVMLVSTIAAVLVCTAWFFFPSLLNAPRLLFTLFFLTQGARFVVNNTMSSQVPSTPQRLRFMSMQTTVQFACMSMGGTIASAILSVGPGKRLEGMGSLATLALVLSASVAPLAWVLGQRVRADAAAARAKA